MCSIIPYNSCRPYNWPFYFGIVTPFIIVMVLNWILYITTVFYIRRSSHKLNAESKKHLQHYVFVSAILSAVFTILWIFGLLGTADVSRSVYIAAQYIFSIMALVHSLLTFLMHILRSPKAKENWLQLWYTCTFRRAKYAPNRMYTTAGVSAPYSDELFQSQELTVNPDSANNGPNENIYSVEPGTAANDSSMVVAYEEVKVNLGREDDDDDRATAL